MNKNEVNILFMRLDDNNKNIVLNLLLDFRMKYIMADPGVDVPYYFYSLNRHIFDDIEENKVNEFLNIKGPYQFIVQSIYYISNYILKNF